MLHANSLTHSMTTVLSGSATSHFIAMPNQYSKSTNSLQAKLQKKYTESS